MASLAARKAPSQRPRSGTTRDVRPSGFRTTREMYKEPAKRAKDPTASVLNGGRTAATDLGRFTKGLGADDRRKPVPASPPMQKARETVKELHEDTDEGVEPGADSYKYSGPGHVNVSNGMSEKVSGNASGRLPLSLSSLDGLAVGESGKILDNEGRAVGKVIEGDPGDLIGQVVNGDGEILDEDGDLIGCVDILVEENADDEREKDGRVWGDDPDGNAVGRGGLTSPQASVGEETYTSPEAVTEDESRASPTKDMEAQSPSDEAHEEESRDQTEEEGDRDRDRAELPALSTLKGFTCNTLGEIIAPDGITAGELVDGDAMRIATDGLQLDDHGQFQDSRGITVGRARPIPSTQSQAWKDSGTLQEVEPIPTQEKPDAVGSGALEGLTMDKDGLVYNSSGQVVGRLLDGGHHRDHNCDRLPSPPAETRDAVNGIDEKTGISAPANVPLPHDPDTEKTGWKPHIFEPESKHARFDMQNLARVIVNDSGYTIDNGRLAEEMCSIVRQTEDSVGPLCRQIIVDIEEANLKPKNRLASERLVEDVKPLITSAGDILQDCNNTLRALDSNGAIASAIKTRGHSTHDVTTITIEYQIAEVLKALAQTIIDTITTSRYRLAEMSREMPYARRKINPLWTLLSGRLFGIITSVGLLHTGVIGLLSSMLKGPWLGMVLKRLLFGIGLDRALDRLGVERLLTALIDGEAWVYKVLDGSGGGVGQLLRGLLDLFGVHGLLESVRVGMVSEALDLDK
ncbi:DUF3659 domain-containing protein [Aspergillus mulundensis]|uniref:DUF6987 domain-containing protein n=1 Tax=Aspergillus mulundensis TaxID=1810919 RepID=A0A3D8QH58_9EURO|nr:hypothetical protein DSM5745_10671 [Aspergillus mulundensis]RDW61173.1 hypothetical protein DSM5745_10671 [Aspergillus mulundensis]